MMDEDVVMKCLGNATSQGFMTAIDDAVHKMLQMAGVQHDVEETIVHEKSGKVMHRQRVPVVPCYKEEEEKFVAMWTRVWQEPPKSLVALWDTGAQAFVLPTWVNECFVNGGEKSRVDKKKAKGRVEEHKQRNLENGKEVRDDVAWGSVLERLLASCVRRRRNDVTDNHEESGALG